ncbi:50S ribosomal protein L1 [Lyticum sinuosum]|uniref:Ribosomal protein n=1 Tax=Lyticum sinuosum TaxID=1332059 RepID=A0AAE4VJL7_9RICK|nr:50S ribosomal protein L1 [Lyticum sinuosum]MDZ5761031.1 50S ribosomal protein L1 [Lyticum sinuosum]
MVKKTKRKKHIEESILNFINDKITNISQSSHENNGIFKMSIDDSITWIKKYANDFTKFDESIEICVDLKGLDSKKSDQNISGTIALPAGTGRNLIIAAFVNEDMKNEVISNGATYAGYESLIEMIKSNKRKKIDVCIAHPSTMAKLASELGKILGPKGLMPNPKLGTVSNDIISLVKSINNHVFLKSDKTSRIRSMIGKISFSHHDIKINFDAFIDGLSKIISNGSIGQCYLTTTQGQFCLEIQK